jgi:hypothetical protein
MRSPHHAVWLLRQLCLSVSCPFGNRKTLCGFARPIADGRPSVCKVGSTTRVDYYAFDLGSLKRGEIVEVTLRYASNVRLMDSSNYSRYRRGDRHIFYGGYVSQSPWTHSVPRSGHWYVVLDLGGHPGRVGGAVRVLPGLLPAARSGNPELAQIVENIEAVYEHDPDETEFDVFISHASEDKASIVEPLARALEGHGLRVWYDDFVLRVGDVLRRRIDAGLARSRFGIVVLSPTFLAKNWPQYELDGLVTLAMQSGRQMILPIWHQLDQADVARSSPSLAGVALRTDQHSVADIARQIADVVSPDE